MLYKWRSAISAKQWRVSVTSTVKQLPHRLPHSKDTEWHPQICIASLSTSYYSIVNATKISVRIHIFRQTWLSCHILDRSMAAAGFLLHQTCLVSLFSGALGISNPFSCLALSTNLIPLLVVLYISSSVSCAIRPFWINSGRYSFNCTYERYALYIILVLVAPPFAASKIWEASSVLLLYFIRINLWQALRVYIQAR